MAAKYDVIPCRQTEIELLSSVLGQCDFCGPECVFVYGHQATGKSTVISLVIKNLQIPSATVNCIEHFNARLIFESLLSQLSQTSSECPLGGTRCDNFNVFVRHLKNLLSGDRAHKSCCLVLDKAERLRDMEINLLPAFMKLQQLTSLKVTVILVSEIVWSKFRRDPVTLTPYVIHFKDYIQDELLEILSLDCPSDCSLEFYQTYLNLVLSVFHVVCRDLRELKHLAALHFDKYIEPVINEQADMNETRRLWRHLEPHLRKALQTVYLREVSSSQWESVQKSAENNPSMALLGQSRGSIELPFYSKFLLIAAYLGSYNPTKSDKRFFTKNAGKINKKCQLAAAKRHERTSNHLLGPKPFPLDRLLAIFYSILQSKVSPSANIFAQVSSLVTLGLLTQLASANALEAPKYKCVVSLEFIKAVAKTVNFEITRYLYDFV